MTKVTFIAPVNIAVIKYWGKKDENLILPLNDSLSITLNTDQMYAKTTVMLSQSFEEDRIWLNGKEESFNHNRLLACLAEIKKRSNNKCTWKVHVSSENNFPTAAGLASSAAGYACLVAALAKAYNVSGDLSGIARQGSGSACRSLYGGFVRWRRGEKTDGSDSVAEQVEPPSHWPHLRILILVICDSKKKVGSTPGMQKTVETSDLLKHRVNNVVPQRIEEMTKAIKARDFEKFAELTMKDSNSMHSVCLDSYPPLAYMNDVSHKVIEFVHAYNKMKGSIKLAYTFDAGPNATLFLEEENVAEVISLLKHVFPPENGTNYVRGLQVKDVILEHIRGYSRDHLQRLTRKGSIFKIVIDWSLCQQDVSIPSGPQEAGLLKYIIHTTIGQGPKELTNDNEHLLDSNGLPYNKTDS